MYVCTYMSEHLYIVAYVYMYMVSSYISLASISHKLKLEQYILHINYIACSIILLLYHEVLKLNLSYQE